MKTVLMLAALTALAVLEADAYYHQWARQLHFGHGSFARNLRRLRARKSVSRTVDVCENNDDGLPCSCDLRTGTIDCAKENTGTANIKPQFDSHHSKRTHSKVKRVLLSNNKITALYKGKLVAGHESTVEELDLSNNDITYIEPGVFDKFTNLRMLDLSGNNIDRIAKGVFSSKLSYKLKVLKLDENRIAKLDREFEHLHQLEHLTLDDNPTVSFTEHTFKKLNNLKKLSLDGTRLEKVEQAYLLGLHHLEVLSMRQNSFRTVPDLHGLTSLKKLDLSENPITEITSNAFGSLRHLRELRLTQMRHLWGVEDCAFCGLPVLTTLVLRDNPQLYVIDYDAFGETVYLEDNHKIDMIDISNNDLPTLDIDLLPWSNVSRVRLAGNPWKCDCDIVWFANRDVHFKLIDAPVCATPERMKGQLVEEVDELLTNCEGPAMVHRGGRAFALAAFLTFALSLMVAAWFFCCRSSMKGRTFQLPTRFYKSADSGEYAYRNLGAQDKEEDDQDRLMRSKGEMPPPVEV